MLKDGSEGGFRGKFMDGFGVGPNGVSRGVFRNGSRGAFIDRFFKHGSHHFCAIFIRFAICAKRMKTASPGWRRYIRSALYITSKYLTVT